VSHARKAAKNLQERVRSGGVFLPEGVDWVQATAELRKAYVEHPELDPMLNGPL